MPPVSSVEGFVFADSSLNSVDDPSLGEKVRSQAGYVAGICQPELAAKGAGYGHILDWASTKVRRVCRGTLAAEAYGLVEGAEAMEWIRANFFDIENPEVSILNADEAFSGRMHVTWYDDANSLVSHLLKDAGQVANKQLRVVIAALREMLQPDGTNLRWIDTAVQLADSLAKWDAERRYLLHSMVTGYISTTPGDSALESKEAIRAGRHRRAEALRNARQKLEPIVA